MADPSAEASVLRAWAAGEVSPDDAFERLYEQYAPLVRAWLSLRAAPAVADDLFQEVWTIFCRRCREWEHRPELMDDAARPVLSFLFRTCHLVLLAHRRLTAQRPDAPLETAPPPAVDGLRTADEQVRLGECLAAAHRVCSDEERAVLSAKLASVPAREIARTLQITESAVDHRFRGAVARIREALVLNGKERS